MAVFYSFLAGLTGKLCLLSFFTPSFSFSSTYSNFQTSLRWILFVYKYFSLEIINHTTRMISSYQCVQWIDAVKTFIITAGYPLRLHVFFFMIPIIYPMKFSPSRCIYTGIFHNVLKLLLTFLGAFLFVNLWDWNHRLNIFIKTDSSFAMYVSVIYSDPLFCLIQNESVCMSR